MRDEPTLIPVAFDDLFLIPPDLPDTGDAPLRDEYERLLRDETGVRLYEE
jgi:hypothetical protein